MTSRSFDIKNVTRFAAGTVGPRGERVFYLQVSGDSKVMSLRMEKGQVIELANQLDVLLDALPNGDTPVDDDMALVEPVVADWVVDVMLVSYDPDTEQFVIRAEEHLLINDPGLTVEDITAMDAAEAKFWVSRAQVAAFIRCVQHLASAGRPPCPFCGAPLNSADWCSCYN